MRLKSILTSSLIVGVFFLCQTAYAQNYWCCQPDDCGRWPYPPCEVPCIITIHIICYEPGGEPTVYDVDCDGTRTNWKTYPTLDSHIGCVQDGDSKLDCVDLGQNCNLPPGMICVSVNYAYYLYGIC